MLVQNLKEMGCHFIETPVDRRGSIQQQILN